MIKTHTFNGKKHSIEFVRAFDGVTDTYEIADVPAMLILDGNDLRSFHSAFHEALEASGFCDSCVHFEDGTPRTIDAAQFLWRWLKQNKLRR